jgi:quinol monooxygenase YgiN
VQLTILYIKSDEDKSKSVFNALCSIQTKLKINPACLNCEVYFSSNSDQKILYMEMWQSKEALQAHIESEIYRDILSIMEWAFETPEIQFYTLTESRGMEFITKTRQKM